MATTSIGQTQQFLTFFLPPHQKAMLPTRQLVEILNVTLSQIVPIPDTAPFVMGVCNWRGEVLWVIDLAYMLGFEALFQQGFSQVSLKVILTRSSDRSSDRTVGLVVRRIEQTVWCDPAQIQPSPSGYVSSDLAASLLGYYLTPQQEVVLALDADKLISSLSDPQP